MIKKILILSLIFVSLLSSAYANSTIPNKCPGIESVKNVPWGKVADPFGTLNWTLVKENNNFDTNIVWGFSIENVRAYDAQKAIEKADDLLNSTRLLVGPSFEDGNWICIYTSFTKTALILALSPPSKNPMINKTK